jgi:phenylpropionate dioxygenase-like ring-hydroxylating dioxygenase large terminal subunit
VARDERNRLRIFENVCTHRGALVERRSQGCTRTFRCLYHNWSYGLDGSLTGVPKPDSYPADFRKEDYGLPSAGRVESFAGLLFATRHPGAASVADYMGELGPIVADTMRHGNVELLGRHRNVIDANWKLFFENTVDAYHAENLHRPLKNYVVENANYSFPNGHGLIRRLATAELMADIAQRKGIAHDSTLIVGDQRTLGVFPNLLMLGSPGRPAVIIRQLIPRGVNRLEIVVYYASPAGLSQEEKERASREICSLFGPAGAISADDAEAMIAVQRAAHASYSKTILTRGLEASPGTAASSSGELSLRGFYQMWTQCMGAPGADA